MAVISGMNTTDAIPASSSTGFTASGAFKVEADGLQGDEAIILYRKGPSGSYYVLTNAKGPIKIGARPNSVYIDIPGDYQLEKTKTASAQIAVSWEEV